mmetsp:Transcript_23849/g.49896  ORF Transcript_23849/g.49896 Transcript_23849/m.49896 type:complete len:81 (+) Transcript_23849:114-356(+)
MAAWEKLKEERPSGNTGCWIPLGDMTDDLRDAVWMDAAKGVDDYGKVRAINLVRALEAAYEVTGSCEASPTGSPAPESPR